MTRLSRRDVLRVGASVVTTVTTGVTGTTGSGPTPPPVPTDSLLAELERALGLERLAEFAYARLVGHVALEPHARAQLRTLHAHEMAHRLRIAKELADRSPVPIPPRDPRVRPVTDLRVADRLLATHGIEGTFDHLQRPRPAIELLLRIEHALEGVYLRLLQRNDADPGLVTLCAEVLGVEAQHVSLLRLVRRPDRLEAAVPDSFVVGPR